MTYLFSPPARSDAPRLTVYLLDRPNDPAARLGRFIPCGKIHVNVWRLKDGTFTESQPEDASSVDRFFGGASIHEVTAAEAAQLFAAGYVVTNSGPVPPLPGTDDSVGGFSVEPYGADPYGS